MDKILGIW